MTGKAMKITTIAGIKGLWSCHTEHQPYTDGLAVYQYLHHWACERCGPWHPGQQTKLPCQHIAAVLAMEASP